MRFFTVPTAKAARSSVVWAMFIIGFFYLLTTFIGFGARAFLGEGGVEAAGTGGNLAAPNLAAFLGGGEGTFGGDLFLAVRSPASRSRRSSRSSPASCCQRVGGVLARHLVLDRAQAPGLRARGGARRADRRVRDRRRSRSSSPIIGGSGLNVSFMVGLAFAVAASANFPALLLALTWRRFNTTGAITGVVARRRELDLPRHRQPEGVAGRRHRDGLADRLGALEPGHHLDPARVPRLLPRHDAQPRAQAAERTFDELFVRLGDRPRLRAGAGEGRRQAGAVEGDTASGTCSAAIAALTFSGALRAATAAIIVANAIGTETAAGWVRIAPRGRSSRHVADQPGGDHAGGDGRAGEHAGGGAARGQPRPPDAEQQQRAERARGEREGPADEHGDVDLARGQREQRGRDHAGAGGEPEPRAPPPRACPGRTSWETVPAMLTSRPDAVDMNAANAPAATIAARMSPGRPGQAAAGTRSTTLSVSPVDVELGRERRGRAGRRRRGTGRRRRAGRARARSCGARPSRPGSCRSGRGCAAAPSCRGTWPAAGCRSAAASRGRTRRRGATTRRRSGRRSPRRRGRRCPAGCRSSPAGTVRVSPVSGNVSVRRLGRARRPCRSARCAGSSSPNSAARAGSPPR